MEEKRTHRIGDFFLKWLIRFVFTTEHFKNIAALMIIGSYCFLQVITSIENGEISQPFVTLVSTISGFYFGGKLENARHKMIHTKQKGG